MDYDKRLDELDEALRELDEERARSAFDELADYGARFIDGVTEAYEANGDLSEARRAMPEDRPWALLAMAAWLLDGGYMPKGAFSARLARTVRKYSEDSSDLEVEKTFTTHLGEPDWAHGATYGAVRRQTESNPARDAKLALQMLLRHGASQGQLAFRCAQLVRGHELAELSLPDEVVMPLSSGDVLLLPAGVVRAIAEAYDTLGRSPRMLRHESGTRLYTTELKE